MSADVGNEFIVTRQADGSVLVARRVPVRLTPEQAVNLAVWLVVMSGATQKEFEELRERIETV